jgi:hypothetical protein
LQVSGLLVSGYLVSGKAYFEAVGQQIVSGVAQNAELAEQMRKMFATFESAYPNDPGQKDRPVPQFVHLQNARFYSTDGTPVPSNAGVWWRGRISEFRWYSGEGASGFKHTPRNRRAESRQRPGPRYPRAITSDRDARIFWPKRQLTRWLKEKLSRS